MHTFNLNILSFNTGGLSSHKLTEKEHFLMSIQIYIFLHTEPLGVNHQLKADGSTAIEALTIKIATKKNRLFSVNLY